MRNFLYILAIMTS